MSVSPIDSNSAFMGPSISPGGQNPQIRALEQKLSQLNVEKRKAAQAKDEEKVKKLEKQIQELEQKIETLKRQEQKKHKQPQKPGQGGPEESPGNSLLPEKSGWYA